MEESMTEERKTSHRSFVLAWNHGGITSLRLLDDVFDTDRGFTKYVKPAQAQLGE